MLLDHFPSLSSLEAAYCQEVVPQTCTRVFEWFLLVGHWDHTGDGSTYDLLHFVSLTRSLVSGIGGIIAVLMYSSSSHG